MGVLCVIFFSHFSFFCLFVSCDLHSLPQQLNAAFTDSPVRKSPFIYLCLSVSVFVFIFAFVTFKRFVLFFSPLKSLSLFLFCLSPSVCRRCVFILKSILKEDLCWPARGKQKGEKKRFVGKS